MKNSEEEARRWLRQAANDLESARLLLREGYFAQTCFMAQQVSEKALKALAYHRGDRFVMGHSLVELVSLLKATYPSVGRFQEAAQLLDQYYVPTRYPNALPGSAPFEVYTGAQAEDAVNAAGDAVRTAQAIVK